MTSVLSLFVAVHDPLPVLIGLDAAPHVELDKVKIYNQHMSCDLSEEKMATVLWPHWANCYV
jgi:hypothetical protein